MIFHDVTRTISEGMTVHPGDPPTYIRRVTNTSDGGAFNLSKLCISSHAGTHVDAPSHIYADSATVDEIPLETLAGKAEVLRVSESMITRNVLECANVSSDVKRLLLKTNSPTAHSVSFLSEDAAHWLTERGVELVGIDTMSVDSPDSESLPVHRTLLGAGVIIVENLDLESVSPGVYTMICLPLKLKSCDGSPARVMLIDDAEFEIH